MGWVRNIFGWKGRLAAGAHSLAFAMTDSEAELGALRRALVVGGSRGIGLAVAQRLRADGYAVSTAARGAAAGVSDAHQRVDVRDGSAVDDLLADPVDIVVHTAAIQGVPSAVGPIWAIEQDAVSEVVEINLLGAFRVLQAAVRRFVAERRPGVVLLFSGGGAAGPRPGMSAYAMTKCAVVRLIECVQAELDALPEAFGIRVYGVAPGAVHTAMTEELTVLGERVPIEAAAARAVAAGEQGVSPDRAAALCAYLIGDVEGRLAGRLVHALEDYRGDGDLHADAGRLRRTPLF